MNTPRNTLTLLTALLATLPLGSTQAATIHTDGASFVTGVSGLQVPSAGTYDVVFVFDSFAELYGSIATPSPVPTFYNDPAGATAAVSALGVEFNAAGGLLGVKDVVSGVTTPDANTAVTPAGPNVVVEGLVSTSGVWSTYSQVAFQFDTDFMHAVFTPIPEPGSLALLGLCGLTLLFRGRRRSTC